MNWFSWDGIILGLFDTKGLKLYQDKGLCGHDVPHLHVYKKNQYKLWVLEYFSKGFSIV